MQTLIHKTALITQSEKGMGKIVAERLAALGATIILQYSGEPFAINQTLSNTEAMGATVFTVNQDLYTAGGTEQLFQSIFSRVSRIDIIVVNGETKSPELTDNSEDTIRKILIYASDVIADKGHIVYLAPVTNSFQSEEKYLGISQQVAALIKELSIKIGPDGSTINTIIPYAVNHTDSTAEDSGSREELIRNTVLKRLTEPEEVANLAEFLATDLSSVITGQHFTTNRSH